MTFSLAVAVAVTAVPAFSESPHPPLQACAVKPMVAGGGNFGTLVGRVLADPDGSGLKVKFDTTAATNYDFGPYVGQFPIPGNWYITEVHAHAACLTNKTTDSFPVNKQGNPTVGKFAVSEKLAPGTQTYEATFEDLGAPNKCPNGVVYVAAHATVRKEGTSAEYSETSWGVQFPFNALTGASQWAQFFEVELNNCDDETGVTDPPANHVPLANNDAYTFLTGGPAELIVPPATGLLANDSDPDGQSLKVASVNGTPMPAFPPAVTVQLPSGSLGVSDNGSFAFKPKAGFTGVVTFAYTATDGFLTSAPATVTITVSSSTPPPPTKPVAASCFQCIGLDCLLTGKTTSCPDAGGQVQDVCTTTVVESGSVRSISRGCAVSGRDTGSMSTLPNGVGIWPGIIQDQSCYDADQKLLSGEITCTFVSDGRREPGSNAPPSLLPLKEFLNNKQP